MTHRDRSEYKIDSSVMAVCKSVTIPGMTGHVRRNTQELGKTYKIQADAFPEQKNIPIKPMVMYGVLGNMQARMEQGCGLDEAADLASYALIDISPDDLKRWHAVGKEWLDIWRYHSSSGRKETFWLGAKGWCRTLGLNYGPILDAFLPNPRSPKEHHLTAKLFLRLVEAQMAGVDELFDVARTVLTGAFKYQPEALFGSSEETQQFWKLLKIVGLQNRATVVTKLPANDREIALEQRDQWTTHVGIPPDRFLVLDPEELDRTLNIERAPQIHLNDRCKNLESPWPSLRFALLAFLVQNSVGPGPVVYRKIHREEKKRERRQEPEMVTEPECG